MSALPRPRRRERDAGPPVRGPVALSLLAAAIHLLVAPEHLAVWWGYGAFFLLAGLGQALLALGLLLRPGRGLALAGVAGNLAIVGLYLVSRGVGIPLGPHAGETEAVGALDVLATAAELGTVAALAPLVVAAPDGPAGIRTRV